jgi:chaperone required for assembly of F1-ATPase
MRELFEEEEGEQPRDPNESARKSARMALRNRFFKTVEVVETPDGFAITLDGKTLRTPARRPLAAPRRAIAEALRNEWDAQQDVIDPSRMPLTRLANSIIDGVADRCDEVAADVVKYFGSDLLFYRADGPDGLVARQTEIWDPIVRWAAEQLGARFVLSEGIVYVTQPDHAVAAARVAVPVADPWTVGALHSVTTLTGSALLALALMHDVGDSAQIWRAAHVDEDWNQEKWGFDDLAVARRGARETEFNAAALILQAMRQS